MSSPIGLVKKAVALLALAVVALWVSPQPFFAEGGLPFEVPVPTPENVIQKRHTEFFQPRKVYDFQQDAVIARDVPPGLSYKLFSAVGFNLANSMMTIGPNGGVVIVDTLGDTSSASEVAKLFLEAYRKAMPDHSQSGKPLEKLPIEAIIYTHNHIDHTGGVQGFLQSADRPVCPPESESKRGRDGSYIGRGDCVEVICQKKVIDAVINTATVAGQMINTRSAYMYGSLFSDPDHRDGKPFNNNGIGPFIKEGDSSFQMPSRTFSDQLLLSVAGLDMQLIYVPSETDDELAIFLPDQRNRQLPFTSDSGGGVAAEEDSWGGPGLLFSAEVLQGPAFPNLYSLRGTSYRNPANWFRSVDRLLQFDSWCMVPSHGPPLCGKENIETLLVNFRDAVQFTHDQAVRYFNLGYVPDQLAELIRLPRYILDGLTALSPPVEKADPKDYLRPLYGSVSQAVREIYFGYLGWFDGDPMNLHPNPPQDLAARRVEVMGGAAAVLSAADQALENCSGATDAQYASCQCFWSASTECPAAASCQWAADCQWAAELSNEVITAYQGVAKEEKAFWRARKTKAKAFLKLAPLATDPNWSNWYITSAMELQEPLFAQLPGATGGLVSPGIVAHLPPGAWVNSWTMRLQAERTAAAGIESSLGFLFPGEPGIPTQAYGIQIRRAVAQFSTFEEAPGEEEWSRFDAAIEVTREAFSDLLAAESQSIAQQDPSIFDTALQKALAEGGVGVLRGTAAQVSEFFTHFDRRPTKMVPVTIHPNLPAR
ncbi:MAG: MBL fold metallo-hydrolase [Deltaproteobacteria bacterium]|nr:MBL fold metallo-hydrolase [Deltaproteobacteria bacterium]